MYLKRRIIKRITSSPYSKDTIQIKDLVLKFPRLINDTVENGFKGLDFDVKKKTVNKVTINYDNAVF